MLLGDILVAHGVVSEEDAKRALARQRKSGGLLGENLIALGILTLDEFQAALQKSPMEPDNLRETGLSEQFVLNLLLKFMYLKASDTPSELSDDLKLPIPIVESLLEFAKDGKLIQVMGSSGATLIAELRYDLTEMGRARAADSLTRSQYLGPAPVPLDAYIAQILSQNLSQEHVSRRDLEKQFGHLVLPPTLFDQIGPAANSARAILFYGPPGSGKTSIAEAVGKAFKGVVHIPYAIEIDNQIITIFDPTLHEPIAPVLEEGSGVTSRSLVREGIDRRWLPCRRPVVMAGGELKMEMLDLGYSPDAGIYEAPLQIKAMNGIFIIDDFGRQIVNPRDLLNRWIVPLEKRFDFMHLATGRKFLIPFDVLIVFSTNMAPEDLMDEAFLRRIPYKVLVGTPTISDYVEIFRRVCAANEVAVPDGFIDRMLRELYQAKGEQVASYHPKFLLERIIDSCRFAGKEPVLDWGHLLAAWHNLFIEKDQGQRV